MTASRSDVWLDLDRSTIVLAGRSFPAVAVRDADGKGWWNGVINLDDPSWENAWGIDVPMENGALLAINLENDRLTAYLHVPVWHRWMGRTDDAEVAWAGFRDGRIVAATGAAGEVWDDCNADWLADHIDRLSRKPVVIPEGKRVKFRPIAEAMAPRRNPDETLDTQGEPTTL